MKREKEREKNHAQHSECKCAVHKMDFHLIVEIQ